MLILNSVMILALLNSICLYYNYSNRISASITEGTWLLKDGEMRMAVL